jgi:hypothetical protein
MSYITHLICICCTLYHLLHLGYAAQPSLIHIFICTYSYPSLYMCVYKVVVVNLLDITALLDLAQALRYTHINIC